MPVQYSPVRNRLGKIVSLSASGPNGEEHFKWEANPDPHQVQDCPDWLLDHPRFRDSVKKGILEQIDQAQADQIRFGSSEAPSFIEQEAARQAQTMSGLDQSAKNYYAPTKCIAPKGPGICGNDVAILNSQLDTTPPLCEQHQEFRLSATKVLDESAPIDGKEHYRWTIAQMGRRF